MWVGQLPRCKSDGFVIGHVTHWFALSGLVAQVFCLSGLHMAEWFHP